MQTRKHCRGEMCIRDRGYSMAYMLFHSDWAASVLKSFIGVLGPLWYALRWWMYMGYALLFIAGILGMPVSYTHLDVYKRQAAVAAHFCSYRGAPSMVPCIRIFMRA